MCCSLTTRMHLDGFEYPYSGPALSSSSNHFFIFSNLSQPVASSAYQTCLHCGCRCLTRGASAIAYIAIASGHPCVVPSCDRSSKDPSPFIKILEGER